MSKLKKIPLVFYVSTLFILIPVLLSFEIENGGVLLASSVAFLFAYLTILCTENKLLDLFSWGYLIVYIVTTSLYFSTYNAMFTAYLLNLLAWHYQEKSLFSKRALSAWITVMLVIGNTLFSPLHVVNKVSIFASVAIAIMVVFLAKFYAEQEALKEAIHEKNKSINFLLVDNERNRISKDLHDTLGHVFAMFSIKSELAIVLLKQQKYDLLEKELLDMQRISNTEMKNVRSLIEGLQHRTIHEELMVIQSMLEIAQIDLELTSDELEQLPIDIQQNAALLLRELVNNLIKHAQATCCRLQLRLEKEKFMILYEDDGCGFDTLTGNELASIRNRLVMLKGDCVIRSLKNPTIIELTIPLEDV